MPTNKHAVIRFNVIDKCLSNSARKWSFNDIKEAIEDKLSEVDPNSSGISVKSLRNDLAFMRSSEGFSAPIETYSEGRKHFYRYGDKDFSITQKPLSDSDADKLLNALSVLQRFEGSPEFEWIEDISLILKDHFGLASDNKKIIGHDNDINISYVGYHLITPIFNAISNKRVLQVDYESFKGEKHKFEFHPYYLKQYNKRWFVFGYNAKAEINQWNIPLDRIKSIKELQLKYIDDETDWADYFGDIIGVTNYQNNVLQDVILRFTQSRAHYVISKPLHESQKQPIFNIDGTVDFKLKLKINPELKSLVLSFGNEVEVIEPVELRDEIHQTILSMVKVYK